jgi:hypothetical protein
LNKMNIGQAKEHLNNAQWQAREAKRVLAEVGRKKKSHK